MIGSLGPVSEMPVGTFHGGMETGWVAQNCCLQVTSLVLSLPLGRRNSES